MDCRGLIDKRDPCSCKRHPVAGVAGHTFGSSANLCVTRNPSMPNKRLASHRPRDRFGTTSTGQVQKLPAAMAGFHLADLTAFIDPIPRRSLREELSVTSKVFVLQVTCRAKRRRPRCSIPTGEALVEPDFEWPTGQPASFCQPKVRRTCKLLSSTGCGERFLNLPVALTQVRTQ